MHFGAIATRATAQELLAALGWAGTFSLGAEIRSFDDAPQTDAAGERVMIAGDHDGSAYLLDESLILSADVDLIVDVSRRLDRLVLSIGAETTSGTYWLIAAGRGRLARCHWIQLGVLAEPYDVGERLAGEPDDGLDDVDGRRLTAVLQAAGFDVDAWRERGRKLLVEATYAPPTSGPDGQAMNAWMAAHMPPGAPDLNPIVAKRGDGFDLVAPGTRMPDGSRVGGSKPGLLGRLFGRR
jgi:hypothetical protein